MSLSTLPLLIPWFMYAAFWIFVVWAIATLIGVLRDIRSELRIMNGSLRAMSGGRSSEERTLEPR